LRAKQPGEPFDQAAYETCVATCVADIARKQAEAGVDVVSDGEFGKSISRSQYVLQRLSGFERRPIRTGGNPFTRGVDRGRFAEFYAELDEREGMATTAEAAWIGPIVYTGQAGLKRDIANFKAALKDVNFTEAFLPVACERHPGPQERVLQKRRGIDPGDRVGDAHRV
jgi:5-methyltetrahydropteroyltriglutamate--homocysteine methyltransferase